MGNKLKKRNVHQPQKMLRLHDQTTMLVGAVSDEKEEANNQMKNDDNFY